MSIEKTLVQGIRSPRVTERGLRPSVLDCERREVCFLGHPSENQLRWRGSWQKCVLGFLKEFQCHIILFSSNSSGMLTMKVSLFFLYLINLFLYMGHKSEAFFDQHVYSDRRFEHVASRAPCKKEISHDVKKCNQKTR